MEALDGKKFQGGIRNWGDTSLEISPGQNCIHLKPRRSEEESKKVEKGDYSYNYTSYVRLKLEMWALDRTNFKASITKLRRYYPWNFFLDRTALIWSPQVWRSGTEQKLEKGDYRYGYLKESNQVKVVK